MKYMLLIYNDGEGGPEPPPEVMQQWFTYTEEMQRAGVMVAGEALQPTPTATSVRVRDGNTLTTDGPFAETKEQLGGFYLMECKDLDEAIVWAEKCPGAVEGTIELRPVINFE